MSVGPERSAPAPPPASFAEEPTRQLSVAGTSDHCVNCGAPLASDQRYCVNCGERRGKPRFSLAGGEQDAVPETTVRAAKTPRHPRTSSTFNLIAGVATLLLAMGVGVLIGHSNSSNASNKGGTATPSITVQGPGAGTNATGGTGAAANGSGSSGTAASSGTSRHKGAAKAATKAAATKKVVIQKAAAAASKVTGGSAKTAAPTVQQGGSCQNGSAGCQNGHFTGNNFFGQ